MKYFEEAFTSEHWIVRIYRVKPQAETEPTVAFKSYADSLSRPVRSTEYRYIGCTASESIFSSDKIYEGGAYGASFELASEHAKTNNKRYFAVAKWGSEGHVFAFDRLLKPVSKTLEGGCEQPCEDDQSKFCGCIDSSCSGGRRVREVQTLDIPEGEEFNRRWAVYEVVKDSRSAKPSRRPRKTRSN